MPLEVNDPMGEELKVLAIVPAFNEEENIVSTVEDLLSNAPGVDHVVINDGSSDRTEAICLEHGFNVITLPVNLGLAGGFQTGMKYAFAHGYDYAVQFDADGQHSAAYVWPMVNQAEADGSDIVIGSRFCAQKKPISARMIGSAHYGYDSPHHWSESAGSYFRNALVRPRYDSPIRVELRL